MRDDKDNLKALDAAVERMRDCLPRHPYIQTIPQDEPRYHHYSRAVADAWLQYAPFDRHEHPNLQYQTWFYRDHGSDLIHLRVHSQSDEPVKSHTHLLASEAEVKSSASTPSFGPKKKISLAAYKVKKVNGTDGTPQQESKLSNHDEVLDRRNGEMEKGRGHHPSLSQASSTTMPAEPSSLKRKRPEADSDSGRKSSTSHSRPADSSQSAKKAKYESSPLRSPMHTPRERSPGREADHMDSEDLPSRLSPLFLPLPGKISPRLPPDIMSALKRKQEKKERQDSPSPSGAVADQKESAHAKDSRVGERPARRLLVRLRIPRRLRQDYKRLLQFPPRPARVRPENVDARRDRTSINETRPGVARARDQPMTPPPPAVSQLHAQNGAKLQLTPSNRKDVRSSVAMRRVESTDGISTTPPVATPVSQSSAGAHSSAVANGLKPSPGSGNATRTAESLAWTAERERLAQLGKDLKKIASEHSQKATEAGESTTEGRRQGELAALVAIESFLAFMLSFVCLDLSYSTRNPPVPQSDARGSWCTLVGFWKFVARSAAPWPPLSGLVSQLGASYNAKVMIWAVHANHKGPERDDAMVIMSRIADGPRLTLRMLKKEFPQTFEKGSRSEKSAEPSPGQFGGGFELPLGMQTEPLQAVRAAYSMLKEWSSREALRYKMKLELDRA